MKRSISLTGQYAAVDEILTAEDNLRMMGRLSGLSAAESRARAAELLEQFDLVETAHKRIKTYSGEMRRRLDLAISLVVVVAQGTAEELKSRIGGEVVELRDAKDERRSHPGVAN